MSTEEFSPQEIPPEPDARRLEALYQLGHLQGIGHGIEEGYRTPDEPVAELTGEDISTGVAELQATLMRHGGDRVDPGWLAFAIGALQGASPLSGRQTTAEENPTTQPEQQKEEE